MKLEGISLSEFRDYDSILMVKADTKRLKVLEYKDKKKKILLNKEREVRKVNAGGMAKKKYRRHYQHVKERTVSWFLENLEKLKDEKYDFDGWFSTIITDQQNGTIVDFIEKEGKWFNYIKGTLGSCSIGGYLTQTLCEAAGGTWTTNTSEFNFQGIGTASNIIYNV